jgi:hypothetical protein
MQAIVWWTVPLVAFVAAIVWVSVANRPRPPVDPHDSVAEHQRFRAAMGRQVGPADPVADPVADPAADPEVGPESPPDPGRPAP